jgi:hypothetical protein
MRVSITAHWDDPNTPLKAYILANKRIFVSLTFFISAKLNTTFLVVEPIKRSRRAGSG